MGSRVEDIMTEDVVTCAADTSIDTVADRMLRNEIGSVIVTNDGNPYGIVTETDIIRAAYHTDRPLSALPTGKVATHPLETIGPKQPVRSAVDQMRSEHVKKLAVVDGLELCGIVTTSDLVRKYGQLSSEIRDIERQRVRRGADWSTIDD